MRPPPPTHIHLPRQVRDNQMLLYQVVKQATEVEKQERYQRFRVRDWLEQNDQLSELLAETLTRPLREHTKPAEAGELERPLVKALGSYSNHVPVLVLLQQDDFLHRLASALWTAAKKLTDMSTEGAEATGQSKFFEDAGEVRGAHRLAAGVHGVAASSVRPAADVHDLAAD